MVSGLKITEQFELNGNTWIYRLYHDGDMIAYGDRNHTQRDCLRNAMRAKINYIAMIEEQKSYVGSGTVN